MISGSGLTIHAHSGSSTLPNPPATITWIYPDGKSVILAEDVNLNAFSNIPITLPKTNSDGSDIDCEPGQSSESYIIKVNDSYSSSGTRNVYYMTFQMNC
jgi:hypothetical protein